MKSNIKAVAMAVALSLTVFTQQAVAQDKVENICTVAADLAGVIMQNRQLGTPISKMMEVAGGDQYAIALILIAYDTPRFSTDEYQQEAVVNFSNEVGLACYKGMTQ